MSLPAVLVVDDDLNAIQLARHILAGECTVRFARSGEDALAQVRLAPPDLVLLDIDMPGLGGLETCRRLKADPATADLPVIFITRFGDEASEAAALDAGGSDFMSKPLTATKVLARVRSQWRARRQLDAALQVAPEQETRAWAGRAPRCLIVDDDPVALLAIGQALAASGIEASVAHDGAEALDLALADPPDVMVLDLLMPKLDGWHVLAAMQSVAVLRAVPVLVVTHVADEVQEARALAAGATDFIAKPFTAAVLRARLRNVLRLRQQSLAALHQARAHWRVLSDARLAEVVAGASDAIVSVDEQGCIRLANRSAQALWSAPSAGTPASATPAPLVGLNLWSLWPELRPVVLQPGNAARVLLPATAMRAGTAMEVRWNTQPPDRDEEPGAATRLTTLFIHDIADRERAEAAQRERDRLLAERQTKARMVSYIAHELGNPLHGIAGLSHLMLHNPREPLSPALRSRIEAIAGCAAQATALMKDVLDLHRIESGRFEVALQPVELKGALDRALASVAGMAAQARIVVSRAQQADDARVLADPVRLQQVLANLLSNAIKYNHADGDVAVAVTAVDGGQWRIDVSDTGIGLTAAQQLRAFEPFNRLGQADGVIPGTGIGLALSRMLVQAMGGELTLSSRAGSGSTFSVLLPAAPGTEAMP